MKNKKIVIIFLSILTVIAALILAFILLEDYIPQSPVIIPYYESNNPIPEDENIQVAALKEIYKDYQSSLISKNEKLNLDESALQNLITKQKFSEKNIDILNSINKKHTNTDKVFTLYVSYSNSDGILTLQLTNPINVGHTFNPSKVRYKLYFYKNKIYYDRIKDIIT